jgi:dUTPase
MYEEHPYIDSPIVSPSVPRINSNINITPNSSLNANTDIYISDDANYVKFRKLWPDAIIPASDAAGVWFDLFAFEDYEIKGGEGIKVIPLGIAVRFPVGTYGKILSSFSWSHITHLCVMEDVITSINYPKENHSQKYIAIFLHVHCCKNGHVATIKNGQKIARLVIEKTTNFTGKEA